ncbi:MAG: glycerol-3-phosphate 1-O-acyltransferase PlsY [Thermodesulfobacteriota bacterium]
MEIFLWAKRIGLIPFAYVLGSIPFGLILTRLFSKADIRKTGSGNIGATNVRRVAGSVLGAMTLLGDMGKGGIPVWLAFRITSGSTPERDGYLALVILAVFSGHLYPLFTGFKGGGKGVATAAGAFLILSPIATAISILVFIMIFCFSDRISPASLGAALALPAALWESTHSGLLTGSALIAAVLIWIRHTENIKRLWKGIEPPFS